MHGTNKNSHGGNRLEVDHTAEMIQCSSSGYVDVLQNIAQSVEKVSLFVLRWAPIAVTLQFMKQFTRRQSVVLNIISAFKMGSSVEVNENCS